MRGAITGKDVILHSFSIVRLWGIGAYLACLRAAIARRPSTFLGTLYPATVASSCAPRRDRERAARG